MEWVAILDIMIITFGIPFIMAIVVMLFKWQMNTHKKQTEHDTKIKDTNDKVDRVIDDFHEYKKISNNKKNEILDAINNLKKE